MGSESLTTGEEAVMDTDWSSDPLRRIEQLASARDYIDFKIEQAVAETRPKNSWQQIATALGVTRQTAWRKYAHTID